MICCCIDHPLCPPSCVGRSEIEGKVDRLERMAAEHTSRLLHRENTALEYKR